MRTILALAVCLALAAPAAAQSTAWKITQSATGAWAFAKPKAGCRCTSPADCTCDPLACPCPNCQRVAAKRSAYEAAHAEAVRLQKPLVVFVGVPAVRGDWVAVAVPAGWGDWFPSGKGIIVSRLVKGVLYHHCDLDPHASANDIRLTLAAPVAPPVPPPTMGYAPVPPVFAPAMFSGGGRGRSC